ncbi:MAG: hypothetical protein ABSE74_03410 [Methanoregula sp.]
MMFQFRFYFLLHEDLNVDDIIGPRPTTSNAAPVLLSGRNAELCKRLTRCLLYPEPSGRFTDE